MTARFRHFEKGAEVVEFLFILMMMMLLFTFFVDFGNAFAIKAIIAEASRTAARAVSVCETDDSARALAQKVLDAAPLGAGEAPYVCDATSCVVTAPSRVLGNEISVEVTFSRGFLSLLSLPALFNPLTVAVTTVMYMQKTCEGTP